MDGRWALSTQHVDANWNLLKVTWPNTGAVATSVVDCHRQIEAAVLEQVSDTMCLPILLVDDQSSIAVPGVDLANPEPTAVGAPHLRVKPVYVRLRKLIKLER